MKAYEALETEEERTKQFIKEYLDAVNSPDWKSKTVKYLRNSEGFLEEHSAFRKSFPDYRSTIQYLAVDGNKGMVWLNIEATYAETFAFENSSYGDGLLRNVEAKNQELSWEETWYFIVVDGKFGEKFDILKDNYAVLKGLGAIE
ncbi:hypothetical protein [Pricia sp.]|uniref:hypothetical protein n=1 Tax=Pricia sp. TaxID=2268138 RepID=UPI00359375A5